MKTTKLFFIAFLFVFILFQGPLSAGIPGRDFVEISQRGPNLFVFRNFMQGADRFNAQFTATAIDNLGNPIISIPPVFNLSHGLTFSIPGRPIGTGLDMRVEKVSGDNGIGTKWTVHLQPYDLVATDYNIEHFFHEEGTEIVWGIGSMVSDNTKLCILKSNDYFSNDLEVVNNCSININSENSDGYRSIYVDQYKNIIIGWRPSPKISRDGGQTFVDLPFRWNDPNHAILSPFWNITEDDNGLIVISEYGSSSLGTHRGTFWSRDSTRTTWETRLVGGGFDDSDPFKFNGFFRHIHGYHINPVFPNIHHMFLGDPAEGQPSDGTPGYYISQDGGRTWSTEIIREWAHSKGDYTTFYNGPCFITWWPNGKAFITSDTAQIGHAYWWGSGPINWGGPYFEPAIELLSNVDEESVLPETPWMAMTVSGTYETYCDTWGNKNLLWRYDADTGKITVLAEYGGFIWLSGSRHNSIPSNAKYFFTSGNRRFPRRSATVNNGQIAVDFGASGLWLLDNNGAWTQLSAWNSENMLTSGSTLYVDLGPSWGIWKWIGSQGSQIHTGSPQKMVASGSVLYADFGVGWGLWKWNGTIWNQIHTGSPLKMIASGSVLYADFGAQWGLWKYDDIGWNQLSYYSSEEMIASGSVLYADLGAAFGLWKWNGTIWSSIHTGSPLKMIASGSVLYADFGAQWGLWKYDDIGWSQLSYYSPEEMIASGSVLYADLGAAFGLWKWNGTIWSSIHTGSPQKMVASGSGSVLYADFGALWKYDDTNWTQIFISSSDNLVSF